MPVMLMTVCTVVPGTGGRWSPRLGIGIRAVHRLPG